MDSVQTLLLSIQLTMTSNNGFQRTRAYSHITDWDATRIEILNLMVSLIEFNTTRQDLPGASMYPRLPVRIP